MHVLDHEMVWGETMNILIFILGLILFEGVGQSIYQSYRIPFSHFAYGFGLITCFALMQLLLIPYYLFHQVWMAWGMMGIGFLVAFAMCIRQYRHIFHAISRQWLFYVLFAIGGAFLVSSSHFGFENVDPLMKFVGIHQMVHLFMQTKFAFLRFDLLQVGWIYVGIGMICYHGFEALKIKNPWYRFTFLCLIFGYLLVDGGQEIDLFGLYRLFYMSFATFVLYLWATEEKAGLQSFLLILIQAGFFIYPHHFYLMVVLLYGILVDYVARKQLQFIWRWFGLWIPLWIMMTLKVFSLSWLLGSIFLLAWILAYRLVYQHKYRQFAIDVEYFLFDHYRIFYWLIPIGFMVLTAILRFGIPAYAIRYSHYFAVLTLDNLKPYFFSGWRLDYILLGLCVWSGFFLYGFIFKVNRQDRFMRLLMYTVILFFANPLCMGVFANWITLETYGYALEFLLNPFMLVLYFGAIYKLFSLNVIGQWGFEILLLGIVILGYMVR